MADLLPYMPPGSASGWNNVLQGVAPMNNFNSANNALSMTRRNRR